MAVPKPLSRHVFQESGERGEGEGAIVAGESLAETTKCGPVEGKQRPDTCSCLLRASELPIFCARLNASETKSSCYGRIDRVVFPFMLEPLNN